MSVTRSRNASSSERKGRRSSPQTRPRNQGDGSLARDACCVPVATRSLSFRRTHHEPGRQPPVGMIDRTRKTQLPSLVHHHRGYRVAICTQSGHFAEITPPGDNSRVIRHDTTPSSTSAILLSGMARNFTSTPSYVYSFAAPDIDPRDFSWTETQNERHAGDKPERSASADRVSSR